MYDWANSAYNLVITSTIFPAYYDAITITKDTVGNVLSHKIALFGKVWESAALYNYAISFAYLIIAFLSPLLSSMADANNNKLSFLRFFCYLGSTACLGMYAFTGVDTVGLGLLLAVVAAIGYCGSLVFYNAYLPEIAPPEAQDAVSAKGFAFGYIGSMILQIICFVFVLAPGLFGITDGTFPPRLSFLLTGFWWTGFASIAFVRLGKLNPLKIAGAVRVSFGGVFSGLARTAKEALAVPVLGKYLTAYFFYSMGVQTVMLAATLFGSQVMRLATEKLIACILVIQLVAVPGAYTMAKLSERFGNFRVLAFTVFVWAMVCVAAYFTVTELQFYGIAAVVGLVMGGIQSLSRSTYSKLLPDHAHASFFSFYDVTEKLAIVIGMAGFGLVQDLTGNMRNAILALLVFFVLGFVALLATIREEGKVGAASPIR